MSPTVGKVKTLNMDGSTEEVKGEEETPMVDRLKQFWEKNATFK